MKLIYGLIFSLLFALSLSAQKPQIQEGKIALVFDFHAVGEKPSFTSIHFPSLEEAPYWNMSGKFSCFVAEGFAIKAGIGLGHQGKTGLGLQLGAQWYIGNRVPIQIDYSSFTHVDLDFGWGGDGITTNRSRRMGFQAGYAFFLGEKLNIEPTIRFSPDRKYNTPDPLTGHLSVTVTLN